MSATRKKKSPLDNEAPAPVPPVLKDQAARTRIETETGNNLVVDAGAGTGKTTELVKRFLRLLLEEGLELDEIVAITFTEKATAELMTRLRKQLEYLLRDPGSPRRGRILSVLRGMEGARISTIHSFCAQVLREYPVEAGLDPRFQTMDETQAAAFEDRFWEEWLYGALEADAGAFVQAGRLGINLGSIAALKDFLLRHPGSNTRSGTTGLPDADRTWDSLKSRLQGLLEAAAGCPSPQDGMVVKIKELSAEWRAFEGSRGETLAFQLALEELNGKKAGQQAVWGKENLEAVRSEWSALSEELGGHKALLGDAVLRNLERRLKGYRDDYARHKRLKGVLDYDDLLLRTRDLLLRDPTAREAVKARVKRLFVDEFQDTDPVQVEIVFFTCEAPGLFEKDWKKVRLAPAKLFLVGDPKQSIYRFRKADVRTYLEAKRKLMEDPGGSRESLVENFRTVAPLVHWVNRRFTGVFGGGADAFEPLEPFRGPGPGEGSLPSLTAFPVPAPEKGGTGPKDAEAMAVAAHVKSLLESQPLIHDKDLKGLRPLKGKDVALLFRDLANYEEAYEDAFRRLEIPYQVVKGKRFYTRPEVVALTTLLEALGAPGEEALAVAVLRSPLFGFSDEDLFLFRNAGGKFLFLRKNAVPSDLPDRENWTKAFALLSDLRAETRSRSLSEAVKTILDRTHLLTLAAAQPHGDQRAANLLKIADQASKLEESENLTFQAFTRWLKRQREEQVLENQAPGSDEGEDRVQWMTIHQSKGLEFPVVILAGAAKSRARQGSLLLDRETSTGEYKMSGFSTSGYEALREKEKELEREESLRLLYVAATRAQDALVVPYPIGSTKQEDPDEAAEGGFLSPLVAGWPQEAPEEARWLDTPEGRVRLVPTPLFPDGKKDPEAFRIVLREEDAGRADVIVFGSELESWRGKREARKDRHLRPKEVLTGHSAWKDSLPEEEALWHWRAGNQGQEPGAGNSGKNAGVLFHRIMDQGLEWTAPERTAAAFNWQARDGEAREVLDLVEKALGSPLVARARRSGRLFRELAVTLFEGERWKDGVLDLAFLEDGGWVIVDYKTDKDPEASLDRYREQLVFYADLLRRSTPYPVKEAHLYFVRPGKEGLDKVIPV